PRRGRLGRPDGDDHASRAAALPHSRLPAAHQERGVPRADQDPGAAWRRPQADPGEGGDGPRRAVPLRGPDPDRRRQPDQRQGRGPLPRGPRRRGRTLSHTSRSDSPAHHRLMTQLTLAIIKPDAVQAGNAGRVLAHLEAAGFQIRAARLVRLSTAQAQAFYAAHRERRLFKGPVETTGELAQDDPLLAGLEVGLAEPVRVAGRLQATGEERFYWHGTLDTRVAGECRRCLAPVSQAVHADIGALFVRGAADDDP